MPTLNVDLDYFEHPKTKRLVGLLGNGADVLPIKLWAYCGKFHYIDGRLDGYSPAEIESIAGWWGAPGELIAALMRVGFLDMDGENYLIHEWVEHEAHILVYKERATDAAISRWSQARKALSDANGIANSNATSISSRNALAVQEQSIQDTSEARRLSTLLLDCILANKPDYKRPNLNTWTRHVDLMIRRDNRQPDAIEKVIRWCQTPGCFWQANILSAGKLRQQFDRLEIEMNNGDKKTARGVAHDGTPPIR